MIGVLGDDARDVERQPEVADEPSHLQVGRILAI
jgi:hypothetical protein